MLSNEELNEINKYTSPHSILVIQKNGVLKRLYTPFLVIVILPIQDLKNGEKLSVEKVLMTKSGITVYKIKNINYYYYYFIIVE